MIIKPKEFLNEHWYLDSKTVTPVEFVRSFYLRSGVHLGGIFSLNPCKDKKCCNPYHFRVGLYKGKTGAIRTKMLNLLDTADDINWIDCMAHGPKGYLNLYNSMQEREAFKITETELVQAFFLKALSLTPEQKALSLDFSRILNNPKVMEVLTKTIMGADKAEK